MFSYAILILIVRLRSVLKLLPVIDIFISWVRCCYAESWVLTESNKPLLINFFIDDHNISTWRTLIRICLLFLLGSQIVISQVRAGGAAELAGLKVGSIVKGVNQQSIKDMSFLQVSNLIRRSRFVQDTLFITYNQWLINFDFWKL